MPKEMSEEVATLMATGLSYEAAYKRVRRGGVQKPVQKPVQNTANVQLKKEPGHEAGHSRPNAAETGQLNVQSGQPGQEVDDPTRGVANLPYPYFRRKVLEETAEEYNERWEAYTREHGHDPVGRKEGWEPSYQDEMRVREAAKSATQ